MGHPKEWAAAPVVHSPDNGRISKGQDSREMIPPGKESRQSEGARAQYERRSWERRTRECKNICDF